MIQSANDALGKAKEIQNKMKKDEEARAIIEATYGMLYAAKAAYEPYPTADADVVKMTKRKLNELKKVFDLKNTAAIETGVDESDSPGEIFAYWFSLWHELMVDRKIDTYAPLCIPGINYCLGGSSMYWTTLTTKVIGVLTVAAIVYRYYWAIRKIVDAARPIIRDVPFEGDVPAFEGDVPAFEGDVFPREMPELPELTIPAVPAAPAAPRRSTRVPTPTPWFTFEKLGEGFWR